MEDLKNPYVGRILKGMQCQIEVVTRRTNGLGDEVTDASVSIADFAHRHCMSSSCQRFSSSKQQKKHLEFSSLAGRILVFAYWLISA